VKSPRGFPFYTGGFLTKKSSPASGEACKHETLDFTCWFEESIGLLNDLLEAAIGQCRVNVK